MAGTQGKSDKELLELLKQNGTQSYKATIKVYGVKDGKADLSNLVATKDLTVNLNGYKSLNEMKPKMPAASQPMATPSMKQDQAPATSSKMPDKGKMASTNKVSSPMTTDQMKEQKDMLPYTGEAQTSMAPIGFLGLALAGLLGGLGLKAKKEEND